MKYKFRRLRTLVLYPFFTLYFAFARLSQDALLTGSILIFFGLTVRFLAAGHLIKSKVFTTSGPYAHIRHPMYLGNFFLGLGISVIFNSLWFVAAYSLLFVVFYSVLVQEEQRGLEEKFGQDYKDYKAFVPAFLPRLDAYPKSEKKKFDLKQVYANGEFIRISGFLASIFFFYLWHNLMVGGHVFSLTNKVVLFLFVVFLSLVWFNISIRRRGHSRASL